MKHKTLPIFNQRKVMAHKAEHTQTHLSARSVPGWAATPALLLRVVSGHFPLFLVGSTLWFCVFQYVFTAEHDSRYAPRQHPERCLQSSAQQCPTDFGALGPHASMCRTRTLAVHSKSANQARTQCLRDHADMVWLFLSVQ